jgi:hypothetical protein
MFPSDPVGDHIRYMHKTSVRFRRSWALRGEFCAPLLERLEQFRAAGSARGADYCAIHRESMERFAQRLADIPDYEFLVPPETDHWIRFCRSRRQIGLLQDRAFAQLRAALSEEGETAYLYGNIKGSQDVENRIREACQPVSRPDLWDVNRFRIVCNGPTQLLRVVERILKKYDVRAIRCRNYYVRPRKGPDDGYRAIHLELQWGPEEFVEVQILTSLREAVGQIDHEFIHKKRVDPMAPWQVPWLEQLSWCANILESREARLYL